MARDFKPSFPYSTAIEVFAPTKTTAKGSAKKTYPKTGFVAYCSFRTFGGTDLQRDGVYSVIDTASVETWYRPDIKSDCRIKVLDTGDFYEIIGKPENINMRNQFLFFKVRAIEGGV